jgi:cytochrome c2
LPVAKFDLPWWQLSRGELRSLLLLLAAYCASALAVLIFVRSEGWGAMLRALGISLGILACVLLLLLMRRSIAPLYLLLPAFALAVVLVPLSVGTLSLQRAALVVMGLATIGVAAMASGALGSKRQNTVATTETTVRTAFYPLRIVSHAGIVPTPATRGGGLSTLGKQVLLGTGDGHLYVLSWDDERLHANELPTRVPANREEFAAAFGGSSQAPKRSIDYSEAGPPRVQTWRFRVADVIAQERGDTVRILASHHFWKATEQCFVVRVSQVEAPRATLATSIGAGVWQTIFESEPCIPMTGDLRKRGKNPFEGEEIGGRMALLDDDTLLLTLGDHGFYGGESVQAYSQDPQAAYGKTIRIDLNTHAHEIFTLGHRNPQGLYAAPDGRIWLTEHGSQGGDELNLLTSGSNYGWPKVTYGTEYGTFAWQPSPQQNRHPGYTQPVMSWVPSVGTSNLIRIERDRFAVWKGDLFVGSLATRSLYRLVVDGDRVVVSEPIRIGRRVRDLLELPDGRLLLWTDDAALVTIDQASGSGGALQFATLCSGCHEIDDGQSHRIGPDLFRIVDRDVAAAQGYDEYSPALKNLGGRWNAQRLDRFLADPQSVAPGTTMAFPGLQDAQRRAALLEYLGKI